MKAGVQNGLLPGSVLAETQPLCATGNCTWPLYKSLAVCTRGQDVSTHLVYSDHVDEINGLKVNISRWSLNDRTYIETGYDVINRLNMSSAAKPNPFGGPSQISNALDFSDTITFSDNPYPLADVFLIYLTFANGTEFRHSAIEFILEWCVQDFNTSVVSGIANTTRKGSTNKCKGDRESGGPLIGYAHSPSNHSGEDLRKIPSWELILDFSQALSRTVRFL